MAVWPASLPQSLPIDMDETLQEGFLRTEMDAGPHKQRRRFSAVSRYIDARGMLLSKTQRQTLDTFYDSTLGQGGDSFDWVDPVDNSTTVSMRFRKPPSYNAVSGGASGVPLWSVSLSLEILP